MNSDASVNISNGSVSYAVFIDVGWYATAGNHHHLPLYDANYIIISCLEFCA